MKKGNYNLAIEEYYYFLIAQKVLIKHFDQIRKINYYIVVNFIDRRNRDVIDIGKEGYSSEVDIQLATDFENYDNRIFGVKTKPALIP